MRNYKALHGYVELLLVRLKMFLHGVVIKLVIMYNL